jgi:hypothetical protein
MRSGNYLSERRPGSQQTKKQLIKGLTGSGWTNYIVAQTLTDTGW